MSGPITPTSALQRRIGSMLGVQARVNSFRYGAPTKQVQSSATDTTAAISKPINPYVAIGGFAQLSTDEKETLTVLYHTHGGSRTVPQLNDLLSAHFGIALPKEELDLILSVIAWSPVDGVMPMEKFLQLMQVIKYKYSVAQVLQSDTADAFVSLGGNVDHSGVVRADRLQQIISEFQLNLDIDQVLESTSPQRIAASSSFFGSQSLYHQPQHVRQLTFEEFCQLLEQFTDEPSREPTPPPEEEIVETVNLAQPVFNTQEGKPDFTRVTVPVQVLARFGTVKRHQLQHKRSLLALFDKHGLHVDGEVLDASLSQNDRKAIVEDAPSEKPSTVEEPLKPRVPPLGLDKLYKRHQNNPNYANIELPSTERRKRKKNDTDELSSPQKEPRKRKHKSPEDSGVAADVETHDNLDVAAEDSDVPIADAYDAIDEFPPTSDAVEIVETITTTTTTTVVASPNTATATSDYQDMDTDAVEIVRTVSITVDAVAAVPQHTVQPVGQPIHVRPPQHNPHYAVDKGHRSKSHHRHESDTKRSKKHRNRSHSKKQASSARGENSHTYTHSSPSPRTYALTERRVVEESNSISFPLVTTSSAVTQPLSSQLAPLPPPRRVLPDVDSPLRNNTRKYNAVTTFSYTSPSYTPGAAYTQQYNYAAQLTSRYPNTARTYR